MSQYKKLASDTVIYGMSSIVGRFLNWWLMPLYVNLFAPEVYGIITNLYSYVAFFMVLLTYGMETGYFRFAAHNTDSEKVYSTSVISLIFSSLFFVLVIFLFRGKIATLIQYGDHPEYISWLAIILAIDAFTAIPFARLRLKNRPVKFAFIKICNIGFNIGFNLFFLLLCPRVLENNPGSWLKIFYSQEIGIGYVFISNLLASALTLVMLLPELLKVKLNFDKKLLSKLLRYSLPILVVGLTGIINQNIDKVLIPFLIPESGHPMQQLGIYGAGVKIAVLMNMFIQAFRYAFEPFFFSKKQDVDDKQVYAIVMKYFVVFGLIIFLGMIFYIDLVKLIIPVEYYKGFNVVPIILMANLFFGIYFTLSLWYKLKDMTRYGAYISIAGSFITVSLNFILVPKIGYMGSAIAIFTCFFMMMVISYVLGQKYYPIPYPLKRISSYFLLAIAMYIISLFTIKLGKIEKYSLNTILLVIFLLVVYKQEKNDIKQLFKISKKRHR